MGVDDIVQGSLAMFDTAQINIASADLANSVSESVVPLLYCLSGVVVS